MVSRPNASALKDLFEKLRNYSSVLRWVARDALWHYRRRVIVAGVLHSVALASQGGALALVLLYARAVESGNAVSVPVLDRTLDARTDATLLIMVAAVALVLLLVSSSFLYLARRSAIVLARQYEERCCRRAMRLAARLPSRTSPRANMELSNQGLQTVLRECRYCGRVLMILVGSLRDASIAMISGLGIFLVNFQLSMVILVLLAVSTVFLYRVNLAAVSHSARVDLHAREASRERKAIIDQIKMSRPRDGDIDNAFNRIFASGASRRYLDAWSGRLGVPESSSLITQNMFAVAIATIVTVQGVSVLRGDQDWSVLLIYLVALRYFLSYVTRIGRVLTSVNRFYPQLRHYFQFVDDASRAPSGEVVVTTPYELSPNGCFSSPDASLPNFGRGDLVGFVTPEKLSHFMINPFLESIESEPREVISQVGSSYWLVSTAGLNLPGELRDAFRLPGTYTHEELREDLLALRSLGVNTNPPPDQPGRSLTEESWGTVSAEGRISLAVLAAARSNAELIFVPADQLSKLPEAARHWLLGELNSKLVVTVHNPPFSSLTLLKEPVYFLMGPAGSLGWTSHQWIHANIEKLPDLVVGEKDQRGLDEAGEDLILTEDEEADDDL